MRKAAKQSSANYHKRSVAGTVRSTFIAFTIVVLVFVASLLLSFFVYQRLAKQYSQVVVTSSALSNARSYAETLTRIADEEPIGERSASRAVLRAILDRVQQTLQELTVDCGTDSQCKLHFRIVTGLTDHSSDLIATLSAQSDETPEPAVAHTVTILRRRLNLLSREIATLSEQLTMYQREWSRSVVTVYNRIYLLFLLVFAALLAGLLGASRRIFGNIVSDIRHISHAAELSIVQPGEPSNGIDSGDVPAGPIAHFSELRLIVDSIGRTKREAAGRREALRKNSILSNALQQEQLERLKRERYVQDVKLQMLQMQINPHFLFNTLGLIRRMAESGEQSTTVTSIEHLAHILRYSLEVEHILVPFDDEWAAMNSYIQIQRYRQHNRVQFVVSKHAETMDFFLPPLILQPILENCIKHGLNGGMSGGKIRVNAEVHAGMLSILIHDNGTGFPSSPRDSVFSQREEPPTDSRHIGLRNIRERLQFCFGSDHAFVVSNNEDGGACFSLTIPPIDHDGGQS